MEGFLFIPERWTMNIERWTVTRFHKRLDMRWWGMSTQRNESHKSSVRETLVIGAGLSGLAYACRLKALGSLKNVLSPLILIILLRMMPILLW